MSTAIGMYNQRFCFSKNTFFFFLLYFYLFERQIEEKHTYQRERKSFHMFFTFQMPITARARSDGT